MTGPIRNGRRTILAILKEKKAPATFFMIGSEMEAHPGLVQRVLADGHEVGNHTYTHPNLADTPPAAVRLELNATQRLFQALTGRSMRLFRSPYLSDAQPIGRRRDRADQGSAGAGLYRGRPPIWIPWTGRSCRCRR